MRISSKGNPYHMPAGSPKGGQFCSKGVKGSILVQNDDGYYEYRTQNRELCQEGEYQEKLLQEAYDNENYMHGVDIEQHCQYVSDILGHLTSDGMETDILFVDENENYIEERAQKHCEIIDEILSNTKAKKEYKALVTGGLGGSGKTTVLKRYMYINTDEYITVNPDDIKEIMAQKGMIPNVKGLTPMEASPLVHEEASHVTKMLLNRAAKEGYNIIIDTTLSNESSARKKINTLKRFGYNDVQPIFVDISPETSIERAKARHIRGTNELLEHHKGFGGRYLSSKLIRKAIPSNPKYNSKNAEVLMLLYDNGVFTRKPTVFNNEGKNPVEIDYDNFVKNGKEVQV